LVFIDSSTKPNFWKEISMMLPNSKTSLIIIALYHCHSYHHHHHHHLLTFAAVCFLMIKPHLSLSVHKYSSCIFVLTSCSLLHIFPHLNFHIFLGLPVIQHLYSWHYHKNVVVIQL
jgi:hypothetical protein